ncbi:ATP-binding protein [Streptomyces sp. NPDC052415]|uniref:ATP-binding protein n=1 Tax=Streptomyces sp. NPDC052415 TaxID=3365690 RepID=UPI0037D0ECCA
MKVLPERQFLPELGFGDGVDRAAVELESDRSSVRHARSFARDQLATWGFPSDGVTDDVVLAVSELVTNAIVHGRTRPATDREVIGIALAFKRNVALGVLVTDNSAEVAVPTIGSRIDATEGRGLKLVNAVADYWTAAPRETHHGVTGKGVWAFFRCPATVSPPPRSA